MKIRFHINSNDQNVQIWIRNRDYIVSTEISAFVHIVVFYYICIIIIIIISIIFILIT